MAKGAATKAKVLKEIMNLYGDAAFLSPDGKELRIEAVEDGETVLSYPQTPLQILLDQQKKRNR